MNYVAILSWLLAAVCFGAGLFNLVGSRYVRDSFEKYGYPGGWHLLTGVLEIAGAILTVLPNMRPYGAALLGIVMIAAFIAVVRHRDLPAIVASIVLTGIAGFLVIQG